MKKKLIVVAVLAMALTVGACGSKKEAEKASSPEKKVTQAEKKEDTKDEKKADTKKESAADISDAVNMEDSSATPVEVNRWMKTTLYSGEDKLYHTVYVRVTKVTTASEDAAYVDESIETHNSFEEGYKKVDVNELNLPADVELSVIDYEVMIPKEFPASEYGMSRPNISLSAKATSGGGVPSADGTSTYLGMGTVDYLNVRAMDTKYEPGNTYPMRGYFAMVKGFTDYNFNAISYPDGQSTETAKYVECVWASH